MEVMKRMYSRKMFMCVLVTLSTIGLTDGIGRKRFIGRSLRHGQKNGDTATVGIIVSQGTKEFIDFVFEKYASKSADAKLNKTQFDKLMTKLSIGKQNGHSHHHHDHHDENTITSKQIDKNKCYDAASLLDAHQINITVGISKYDFARVCPSFIQQIENGNCGVKKHKEEAPTATETWGYGFLSITIISFMSLALVGIIPFIKKSIYARVMCYLVALGVGTLSGDAMLHLIPHAFGEGTNAAIHLDVSEEEEHRQEHAQIWRALFVLLGIYAFFAVELLMKLRGGHGHSHGHSHEPSGTPKGRAPSVKVSHENKGMDEELNDIPNGTTNNNTATHTPVQGQLSVPNSDIVIYKAQRKQSMRDPGEKMINKETKVATVAWVVIIGDGFHNFSDGLAIGAAFSASLTSGLSTSIAVFCHELPHELGDFAVLLNAGMTMKQAIVYNIVSTIAAYVGLTVGILAGENELGRHIILSITAGLFLYVSLADLLPELTNEDIPDQPKWVTFVIQHLGIITGIGIMLVIALFEHEMHEWI